MRQFLLSILLISTGFQAFGADQEKEEKNVAIGRLGFAKPHHHMKDEDTESTDEEGDEALEPLPDVDDLVEKQRKEKEESLRAQREAQCERFAGLARGVEEAHVRVDQFKERTEKKRKKERERAPLPDPFKGSVGGGVARRMQQWQKNAQKAGMTLVGGNPVAPTGLSRRGSAASEKGDQALAFSRPSGAQPSSPFAGAKEFCPPAELAAVPAVAMPAEVSPAVAAPEQAKEKKVSEEKEAAGLPKTDPKPLPASRRLPAAAPTPSPSPAVASALAEMSSAQGELQELLKGLEALAASSDLQRFFGISAGKSGGVDGGAGKKKR